MPNGIEWVEWGQELRSEMLLQRETGGVFTLLDREIRRLGFDYYACAIRHVIPFTRPPTEIIGSYPNDWLKHYREQQYASVDPVIINGLHSREMVVWGDPLFETCRTLWGEAREHGLRVGATFPLRTSSHALSVLSVAREHDAITARESDWVRSSLRGLFENVTQRLGELRHPMLIAPDISISQREREILQWTADGKSSGEIALILDISINTVNFHLKAIQKKFGAPNKTLAAAYAAALGMI
jgi:LuxR family transcriptional activator of rhlAB and lasB